MSEISSNANDITNPSNTNNNINNVSNEIAGGNPTTTTMMIPYEDNNTLKHRPDDSRLESEQMRQSQLSDKNSQPFRMSLLEPTNRDGSQSLLEPSSMHKNGQDILSPTNVLL